MVGILILSFASTLLIGLLFIVLLFPWILYDIIYIKTLNKIGNSLKQAIAKNHFPPEKLKMNASLHPNKPFLLYEDEVWTYEEMSQWVNKITRALHEFGLKQGDQIALMMYNEPSYVAIVLACFRLGIEVGLINYNLRLSVLKHSLGLLDCKLLLVGGDDELLQAVFDIRDEIDIPLLSFTKNIDGKESLKTVADKQSSKELEEKFKPNFPLTNTACYIYTSGTTGKPKAVRMSFITYMKMSQVLKMVDCKHDDVVYCALPLYHTAGSIAAVGSVLYSGVTVALRKKFSASNCIKDCIKYKATILQYIGETMRYICLQPPTPEDRNHKLRIAYGNGMRCDVWKTFIERFSPHIRVYEFYGSTEGNASFMNMRNKLGAVGFISPIIKRLMKVALVRYDHDAGEACRDANGRCVEVGYNEPGLLIRKISKTSMYNEYKGNKDFTERKILRNVFEDGDSYYNSGDLLTIDESYAVYFTDRVGDTYRWKGENVSTSEVSDVICTCPGVAEAIVYGVKVKGNEGRAGMVTISPQNSPDQFDLIELYNLSKNKLPKYAIPLFVRIGNQVDHTGTMKQVKVQLVEDGYDPGSVSGDPLYFLDPKQQCYIPLTDEVKIEIDNGLIKI